MADEPLSHRRVLRIALPIVLSNITVPLLGPALFGSFFLAFVFFFREFAISVLLFQSGTEVFSVAMFDMFTNGNIGEVGAVSVIFVAAVVAMLAALSKLLKSFSLYGD